MISITICIKQIKRQIKTLKKKKLQYKFAKGRHRVLSLYAQPMRFMPSRAAT